MEKKEIVYGRNPVLEYIKQINKNSEAILYVLKSAHGKILEIIINHAKEKGIKIEFCRRQGLAVFEPTSKHQGVVLLLPEKGKKNYSENIEVFLEKVYKKNGVLVLLDQLTDPQNLGSIIRSTEALGGQGVIITKSRSAKITAAVIKVSAGATAYLPVYMIPNAANFIDNAKKKGFWIIGTSDKGNSDINKLKELKPAVIIVGSEGVGMRRLIQEKCDYIIRIPLKGNITSLNASVAAGIILYEALSL